MKYLSLLKLILALQLTDIHSESNPSPKTEAQQLKEKILVLDLNHYFSDHQDEREKFIEQFGNALHTTGFVMIKNHQISQQNIDAASHSSRAFFDLPEEDKLQYQGKEVNRGYKGFTTQQSHKKSDLQEYWHVGPTTQLNNHLNIPEIKKNIWPNEIDSFEKNLSTLYEEIREKGQPILEACSLYMGKEKTFLSEITEHGDSVMRFIHYLPSEDPSNEKTWKAAHQDPNLLTIITGVSMEGLEVQTKDGNWITVPYHPDTIIVSSSNMLESLSNGLIRSAPHRVVIQQSNKSRFSIPFFYHVQRNLSIGPQKESILKTNGDANYFEQTAEESLKGHFWFTPSINPESNK